MEKKDNRKKAMEKRMENWSYIMKPHPFKRKSCPLFVQMAARLPNSPSPINTPEAQVIPIKGCGSFFSPNRFV